jgi:hypothetical protein
MGAICVEDHAPRVSVVLAVSLTRHRCPADGPQPPRAAQHGARVPPAARKATANQERRPPSVSRNSNLEVQLKGRRSLHRLTLRQRLIWQNARQKICTHGLKKTRRAHVRDYLRRRSLSAIGKRRVARGPASPRSGALLAGLAEL